MRRLFLILLCVLLLSGNTSMLIQSTAKFEEEEEVGYTSLDFTTFTEVDQGNDITIDSASKVSWTNFATRGDKSYVYKDMGVGFFDGDFTIRFEYYFDEWSNYQQTCFWALSNAIGDNKDMEDDNGDHVFYRDYDDSDNRKLVVLENGSATKDQIVNGNSRDILFYCTVTRDDDAGANSTGQYKFYLRTGSHEGVLLDTLSIDASAGEQNDFRYIYCLTGYDTGWSSETTGYVQNMEYKLSL